MEMATAAAASAKNGVTQIVAGEIAGSAVADDFGSKRLFLGAAQHPNRDAVAKRRRASAA